MSDFDDKVREMARSERTEIPAAYEQIVQQTLSALPEKKKAPRIHRIWKRAGIAAAVLIVLFIGIPNISFEAAQAMEKIPLIGNLVEVVTFRTYHYESERYHADVTVPQIISDRFNEAVVAINNDIDKSAEEMIAEFKEDIAEVGVAGQDTGGYHDIYVDSEVVTDNVDWFTIKVVLYQGAGSGYQRYRYYSIDKANGQWVLLKDLFPSDSDYIAKISQDIKEQMRAKMAADEGEIYWVESETPEWDFKAVAPDQNFYFNEAGNLVIVFDEYEVAPGYMGCPEFEIPSEVVADIRQ